MSSIAEQLAAKIEAMTPPERLRFAALLMEKGRGDMAYPIIERVKVELGAALALRRVRGER